MGFKTTLECVLPISRSDLLCVELAVLLFPERPTLGVALILLFGFCVGLFLMLIIALSRNIVVFFLLEGLAMELEEIEGFEMEVLIKYKEKMSY
jgi:nitrate reductase NapE component